MAFSFRCFILFLCLVIDRSSEQDSSYNDLFKHYPHLRHFVGHPRYTGIYHKDRSNDDDLEIPFDFKYDEPSRMKQNRPPNRYQVKKDRWPSKSRKLHHDSYDGHDMPPHFKKHFENWAENVPHHHDHDNHHDHHHDPHQNYDEKYHEPEHMNVHHYSYEPEDNHYGKSYENDYPSYGPSDFGKYDFLSDGSFNYETKIDHGGSIKKSGQSTSKLASLLGFR